MGAGELAAMAGEMGADDIAGPSIGAFVGVAP
jgi:hypothetical protein